MSRAGSALLGAVAGVLLLGATAADWVRVVEERTVGGVPLSEVDGMSGAAVAGPAMVSGLAALLVALVALAVRGRWAGAALMLCGGVALVTVIVGLVMAASMRANDGVLTPWPGAAVAASGLVVLAGWLVWRRPQPRRALGARYTVDETEEDAEWRRAEGEDT